MKLPVFLLCLLSQFLCFAFARGEARRPEASVAQPALPEALADTARFERPPARTEAATVAARVAVAQALLDGDLDAWLPELQALAAEPDARRGGDALRLGAAERGTRSGAPRG